MSPKTRRAIACAQADALGLTPAGRARYVPYVELEDEAMWDGFWDWFAREGVASGGRG